MNEASFLLLIGHQEVVPHFYLQQILALSSQSQSSSSFFSLPLFYLLEPDCKKYEQDGEKVEFEVIEEPNGRFKAYNVTGPDGSYVQGAPKRFSNNEYGHDESGGY